MTVEINATFDTLNLGIRKCLRDIAERRALNKINRLRSNFFNTGILVQFLNHDGVKISRNSTGFSNLVNNEINEMLGYYIFKDHHKFITEVEANILKFSEDLLKVADFHKKTLDLLGITIDPQKILNSQKVELDYLGDPRFKDKPEFQLILSYNSDELTLREKFYYAETYSYINSIRRLDD